QQIDPQITENPEQARQELAKIRNALGDLSEEVRRISHALHPSVIDDLGIAAALRSLVEDFRERESMIVTLTADPLPRDVPAQIATSLYRIAQEALRNVAKHAGRTHVKVALRNGAEGIRLQVIDSGEGFDVQDRRSGLGLGLISMEERVRMVEGKFSV